MRTRFALLAGKGIALLVTAGLACVAPARAQWTTEADIYGQPEFGTTTRGPGGSYRTEADIYGQPQFGTTTRGPNGSVCCTEAAIYGQPQFGTTTRCH